MSATYEGGGVSMIIDHEGAPIHLKSIAFRIEAALADNNPTRQPKLAMCFGNTIGFITDEMLAKLRCRKSLKETN